MKDTYLHGIVISCFVTLFVSYNIISIKVLKSVTVNFLEAVEPVTTC
jgi:hypothetical protein